MKNVNGQTGKGKSRNKIRLSSKAYYAIAVVLVVLCVQIFSLTVFFGVGKIEVEGVTLYRNDQILNVGGAQQGANLIRLDASKIEDRIKENLVFVDDVKVTKKYPSTVVISCTEAVKAADIEYKDSYYVLSESGRILEAKNPSPTGDIPIVKGFELKSQQPGEQLESTDAFKADILNELIFELKSQKFGNITEIDMTSRSNITLNYDDRIEIKVGSSSDLGYKLKYFKAVIDSSLTSDYEGTLIYNGADSGISAIPKEQEAAPEKDTDSSETGTESQTDETSVQTDAQWGDAQTDYGYGTDTENGGYGDGAYTDENQWGDNNDYGYYEGNGDNADYGYGDNAADGYYGYDDGADNGYYGY